MLHGGMALYVLHWTRGVCFMCSVVFFLCSDACAEVNAKQPKSEYAQESVMDLVLW